MQQSEGGRLRRVSRRSLMHAMVGGAVAATSLSAAKVGTAFAVPIPARKPHWEERSLGEVRRIAFAQHNGNGAPNQQQSGDAGCSV